MRSYLTEAALSTRQRPACSIERTAESNSDIEYPDKDRECASYVTDGTEPISDSDSDESEELIETQSENKLIDNEALGCEGESLNKIILFGCDLSNFSHVVQFLICAGSMMTFSVLYGLLQELISVHLLGRKFALFFAAIQLSVYATWSLFLSLIGNRKVENKTSGIALEAMKKDLKGSPLKDVPVMTYIFLSVLKCIDLSLSNMSMRYLNYPAKSLIKSCRVFFVMISGIFIAKKKYKCKDFLFVSLILAGLMIFLHADSNVSAIFHPIGIFMMITGLTCDGALNNFSEVIMNKYSVCHDRFNCGMYSIACVASILLAHTQGELIQGFQFLVVPGSVNELEEKYAPTWSVPKKIFLLLLFSSTGIFGASSAGAITKNFGALATSTISTTRRALTLFLSFFIFQNECTIEHLAGITVFFCGLFLKILRARKKGTSKSHQTLTKKFSSDPCMTDTS